MRPAASNEQYGRAGSNAAARDDPWWATDAAQHSLRYGHVYQIAVDGIVGPNTWQALVDPT